MSNIVEKARKKLPDLVQMAGFGYYEQVYPKDDPSIVDIIKSTKQKYHEEQQYWRLISSGDSWDKHSGIFKSIRVFLKKCAGTQKYKQSLGLLHSQIDGLKFEINATKSQHGNLVFDTFVKYADKAILKLKKVASNNRNNAPKQTSLLQVGKMIDQDATSKFRRSTTRKSTVHQRKNFEIEAEAVSRSPPKMPRIFGPKIVPSDDCGSTNISSSDHNSDGGISTSLTKFIQAFQKQFRGQSFLEKFDEHPAKSIIYEQIKNGGPQDQLYFNKSCELFKSFSERTILFKLLKKSIKAAETEKQQQKITQAYFKCGIFEMAVTSLIQRKDNNEELAAIRLLNQMIEKPAPRFQIKLLNWLSESNKYYKLFLFIQEEIEESKERILAKYAAEWKKDEGSMVAVLDLILPGALDEFRDNNFATRTKSIKIHLNVVRFMQL